MATPSEKLAQSLEILKKLQDQGVVAIRSKDMTRTHRERLLKNGFLQNVMKGWYIPTRPDENTGESTAWYTSFWSFCTAYLTSRFGDEWSLSPEQSLLLHAGNKTVPNQLLIRATKGSNNVTQLPFNTSLLDIRGALPANIEVTETEGLHLFSLPIALIECSPNFFRQYPTDARAALSMIRDASEILGHLLEGGHSTIAGRLAGAFRNIGRERIANNIVETMRSAGYEFCEDDPFENKPPILLPPRELSAYVNRIRLMWQEMRQPIIDNFPSPPAITHDIEKYMKNVEDAYITDAHNSLSIEGYHVSPELIDRARKGNWNPDNNINDRENRNALAARGYWQAYQAVRASLEQILQGKNAGDVTDEDHGAWYREMFAPGVTAGILKPSDLAGYRNGPVYIRRSMHVPPNREAVRDAMPAFFDLLREEPSPAVRVVLGHFTFVYIHPYMDGNGRMGRFLMNTMLASGGYQWTVVPVERRSDYMSALEEASVRQNIIPFSKFLADLVTNNKK